VSSPTCADDIALLGCKGHELQASLDIVQYTGRGRDLVTINPAKSEIVNTANRLECPKVKIDNNEITEEKEAKHLGLIRKAKNKLNIEDCLKIGRQTTYALLGSGLHARRGMSPIIALKIWRTYVSPKLLYGIEIMTYTKTDLQKLERLQLKILKQFQDLSERTTNVGVYSLLGIEPIAAVIDRNTISFHGGIIRNKSTIEFTTTKGGSLTPNL